MDDGCPADTSARGTRFVFRKGTPMRRLITRAIREECGQDLVEYALLAAFISLIAIAAVTSIGAEVNGWYLGYDSTIKTIPGGGS
jgi:Flp pilus assembly pilin Flp